jgi:hypothetical protein
MAALHINDAGTWRQIQSVYVNDAGTWRTIQKVWVNDTGTWRQVYVRRPPESGTVTAGTNGTAYGYQRSGYGSISGFPGTGGLLSDLALITRCIDTDVAGDFQLIIDGVAGGFLPPANYFTSILAHGQTRLASAASYSTAASSGVWTWSGGQVGWWQDAGTPYTVTITF